VHCSQTWCSVTKPNKPKIAQAATILTSSNVSQQDSFVARNVWHTSWAQRVQTQAVTRYQTTCSYALSYQGLWFLTHCVSPLSPHNAATRLQMFSTGFYWPRAGGGARTCDRRKDAITHGLITASLYINHSHDIETPEPCWHMQTTVSASATDWFGWLKKALNGSENNCVTESLDKVVQRRYIDFRS
jgi:hypothetical protein